MFWVFGIFGFWVFGFLRFRFFWEVGFGALGFLGLWVLGFVGGWFFWEFRGFGYGAWVRDFGFRNEILAISPLCCS